MILVDHVKIITVNNPIQNSLKSHGLKNGDTDEAIDLLWIKVNIYILFCYLYSISIRMTGTIILLIHERLRPNKLSKVYETFQLYLSDTLQKIIYDDGFGNFGIFHYIGNFFFWKVLFIVHLCLRDIFSKN